VILLVAIAFVASLVLGGPNAMAQENKVARGTVSSMTGDTLVVKVGTQDMTFTIDKATQVIERGAGTADAAAKAKGKEGASAGELLKPGEGVEVHYVTKGAGNYAKMIRSGLTPAEAATKEAGKSVSGTAGSVAANMITVSSGGQDFSFAVNSATKVIGRGASTAAAAKKQKGEATALTDFVGTGDTVLVSFSGSGTGMTATEIRVVAKAK
jgi:hypothetical protein